MDDTVDQEYDYVVVGSGFGGSVSALRLTEKGYRVLVLEKGRRFSEEDFPKTNWNLRRWLWLPLLRFFGFFKITLFRHVMVLSGVGVGGGSLVYANTLARPMPAFFQSPNWPAGVAWEEELEPHYATVLGMLGAAEAPVQSAGDRALARLAAERGRPESYRPTRVAVFFGEPGKRVEDPYFDGKGPDRSGCTHCGACMTGCRYGAKNTLDKNYLHLAERGGAVVQPEALVEELLPLGEKGEEGYLVRWRRSGRLLRRGRRTVRARGVIIAGGVLGSVPLLLRLGRRTLPRISPRVGCSVRTNSETLVGVTAPRTESDFSEGVAIASILRTSERTTLEPVRYGAGSGVWRLLMAPMSDGGPFFSRLVRAAGELARHPIAYLRIFLVGSWATKTQILLFMQSVESTLRFVLGPLGLKSESEGGAPPNAFIPEARELTRHFARIVGGKPMALVIETLSGIPSTAHILGGCVIGSDASTGVVDERLRLFGYENLLVCDGSVVPANPGANPSLTIAALAERAMSFIPPANINDEA